MSDECESVHAHVPKRECTIQAAYKFFTCRNILGRPVCAPTIEDPERGYARLWQDRVDDGVVCTRCQKPIRFCWSWIPI